MVEQRNNSTLTLTRYEMEVIYQLHALTVLPPKAGAPPTHWIGDSLSPRDGLYLMRQ
jgi:hypothetical protein